MKALRIILIPFLLTYTSYVFSQHTFSIVAVDINTGQVGTAGATCLTSADCGGCGGAVIISNIYPGLGALNSQAQVCIPNTNGINGMRKMIVDGFNAEETLDWLLANDDCQFGGVQDRQYGIAMLDDNDEAKTASFTGSNTLNFANHITGPNYSIQGNILIGEEVLEGMEQGFLSTNGSLAEKLMAAMQGANIPGADSRCLSDGISSKSSFLKVAKPDDAVNSLYIDLLVPDTDNLAEPIDSLQSLFNAWLITSSEEIIYENALSIFPNPASNKINIQVQEILLNGNCVFELYNEMGQLVLQKALVNKHTLFNVMDFSLNNGLYIYKLNTDDRLMKSGKLIIHN